MEELWHRIVDNFVLRMDGPFHFRLIAQPLVAAVYAIIDGLKDAKNGKPAYFWALATHPGHRMELLKNGWKHVGKIFIIAIILDVIYQLKVQDAVNVRQTLIVALVLAVLPYLLLRGPVNRIRKVFKR